MNYAQTPAFNLSTYYPIKSVISSISSTNLLELTALPYCMEGYIQGSKQPLALVKLRISLVDNQSLDSLKMRLDYFFSVRSALQNTDDLAHCFGEALCILQKRAGFPVFESFQIQAISAREFFLYVPCVESIIFIPLVDCLCNIFNQNIDCEIHHLDKLDAFLQQISQQAPKGSNSLRFLQAASDLGIPWTWIEQNIWQFGHGVASRWFDSSLTDKTSVLSTNLARNKVSTARLLAKAGLPVPEQILAQHEIEILEAAKKIGFPLVMKPLDSDGGNGVLAGLRSETGVKKAWQLLSAHTKTVLIEKQVIGKDYRLQILQGELVWAVERIPASIVGDGKKNIKTLIDALTIEISDTMILFLTEQGYTLDHILQSDETISIQGVANISAGGTPIAVFDTVHPDNKHLAETAANLLRLDMAGIDLIMPDISKSWLETSATIIEVNAQPQFGIITASHIYKDILSRLMPDKGRIPVIVLIGSMQPAFIQAIQAAVLSDCKAVGLAKAEGAFLHHKKIASTESPFRAGKSLLLNNQVDGLIFHLDNLDAIKLHGLPFDAFDHLFLLDIPLEESLATATILKACRGYVITNTPVSSPVMHSSIKLAVINEDTNSDIPDNLSEQEKLLLISGRHYCR